MLFALGLTWCSSVVIGQFRSLGNVMICFCQLSRKDFLFGNVILVKYSAYLKYQKNNSPASVYDFPLTRSAWVFDQLKREESTIEALCERNTALAFCLRGVHCLLSLSICFSESNPKLTSI